MVRLTLAKGLLGLAALASATSAMAVPNPAPEALPVIKYESDMSSNRATEASNRLAKKQSGSNVYLTCYTQTDCTGQATVHQASGFTSNQPCINAPNCQCMIVKNLDNAHIKYWNHQTCNGNESGLNGCFDNANVQQPSPGTNSLGFHVGCSGN